MDDPNSPPTLLRRILDAMPLMVMAVDEDVRIVDYNAAAAHLVGTDPDTVLRRRGGDVIHCLNARETPQGCGSGPRCSDCVIRNSVVASARGQRVVRQRTRLDIELAAGGTTTVHALVTTSPFEHEGQSLVLLVVEDISELVRLKEIVPICARCKKVRTDQEYWIHVESFIQQYADVDFSHGYCPQCAGEEKARIRAFVERRSAGGRNDPPGV